MTTFTPLSAAIGGALIGLAAVLFLLVTGRIAGISGILGGALPIRRDDLAWRTAFLVGVVLGPLLVAAGSGAAPEVSLQASLPVLVIAGLLVGFGTRMGGGCTSGHGVCGISRGAPRSIWATVAFFAAAAITVFLVRHVVGG